MDGGRGKSERDANLKNQLFSPELQYLVEGTQTAHLVGQLLLKAESNPLGWGHKANVFYCGNAIIGTQFPLASCTGVKGCTLF